MRAAKPERTLLLRFNLNRKIDREIWEWLHDKNRSQTLSMNAFLIEGLRKLMENEKPLDAHALAEEICRELHSQGLALSSEGNPSESSEETLELSDDIMDFANSF